MVRYSPQIKNVINMKMFKKYFSFPFAAVVLLLQTHAQAQQTGLSRDSAVQASDEMQVIAYGELPKRSVTGTVSSISGKDLEKNTVFSLGNALFGKIAGLVVTANSGEPGNDLPSFALRGVTTFGFARAPLVLVDGFIRDLNAVSVFDVDKISVLKDAASTALYGIQGANGVILVTTKSGKAGKSSLDVDVSTGFQSPTRLPQFYASADYAKMYNQALANDRLPALFSAADLAGYAEGDRRLYPNVDWMNETIRQDAPITSINLSSSGGNKVAHYYVSLGYLKNTGIYKNTDLNDGYSTNSSLDRLNFRSNIDVSILNDITLKLNLGGQLNDINAPRMATADIWNRLYDYPAHLFPVYAQPGLLGGTAAFPDNPAGYINNRGYKETHNRFFQSDLDLKYDASKLLKGLAIGARVGFDNYYTVTDGWSKTFAVYQTVKDSLTGKPIIGAPIGNNTNLAYNSPFSDAQNRRGTAEIYLHYRKSFGADHLIDWLALYNQTRQILGRENPYNMQSLNTRVHYAYKNRLFADLSVSYGGTEAFAKDQRFGLFPALALGFVLIDTKDKKSAQAINYLKLRSSAGMVGSSNVGSRFAFRELYVGGPSYFFGNTNAAASTITEGLVANPDMTFEQSYQYDLGMDLRLFNNLDLSLVLFQQDRKNILTSQSTTVPALFGASLPNVNMGEVRNRGIEMSLLWTKQFKHAGFFARLNMSLIKDKVMYMAEEVAPEGSEYFYRTGSPVFYTYGLQAIGFFESATDIAQSPLQIFGPVQPGDIKYQDRNKDGIVNNYDVGPIGNGSIPTKEFGLDLGFNVEGFDFQVMIQAQVDRNINLANYGNIFFPLRSNQKISTFVQNPWTPANMATAAYPRLSTLENANNYRTSSFWLRNGDFIKLRSLEMGYNFPIALLEKTGLSAARFYVRAMNMFTLDKFKYADPENISGYPTMRSVNMGFKIQL
jgi:TonB-linked SusC/RagA family outer membrane protein